MTAFGGQENYNYVRTPTNESHTFRLVGINHDKDASNHTLGMTFEQTDLMNATYVMEANTIGNENSWSNNDLITTINNNFVLPEDLNNVITAAQKPCVTSVSDSTLKNVTSKLWIMSETEIAGTQNYTYGYAEEGTQYAYYVTNNTATARIKQKKGTNYWYWLRSAYYWNESFGSVDFAEIHRDGTFNYGSIVGDAGVSVCFCI